MANELTNKSLISLSELYTGETNSWIRANMVLTLDGNYVDTTDSSRGLSSDADLKLLLLLRAISDVVLVGAQTARLENYPIPKMREEHLEISSEAPRLCVVTHSMDLSPTLKMFQVQNEKPIIITKRNADSSWLDSLQSLKDLALIIVLDEPVTGQNIIHSLRELALTKVVCEGGPSLLSLLQKDALIDEMDITYAPVISGKSPSSPALGTTPSQWHCKSVIQEHNHLFTRFIKSQSYTNANSVSL